MQDNSGRLLKHMASAADDLDALFTELDLNLTNSRNIFSQIPSSSTDSSDVQADRHDLYEGGSQTAAQLQPVADAANLQVPAYVHVGDPLVTEEPFQQATPVADSAVDW